MCRHSRPPTDSLQNYGRMVSEGCAHRAEFGYHPGYMFGGRALLHCNGSRDYQLCSEHQHLLPIPAAAPWSNCARSSVNGITLPKVPLMHDYGEEKPEAYIAFLQQVSRGAEGAEVSLDDRTCLDHHVEDLLACLESWFARELGTPSVGRPWRLGRLSLTRNNLSGESVARIADQLRHMDVRLRRLDLDYNSIDAKGLSALTDYIWNCPDTLYEIGLASNNIVVTPADGDDAVSALLRCLYNHSGYPRKIHRESGTQVVPLTIRLSDNYIADSDQLLSEIQKKGGNERVSICSSADPPVGNGKEYLAVFLPDLARQRSVQEVSHVPKAITDGVVGVSVPRMRESAPGLQDSSASRGTAWPCK